PRRRWNRPAHSPEGQPAFGARAKAGSCGLLERIEPPNHVEALLIRSVELAGKDALAAVERLSKRYPNACATSKRFGDFERLRQESLQAAGSAHQQAVVLRQLVDAQHSNDVLELAIACQRRTNPLGQAVVALAHHLGIQQTRF